MTTTKKPTTSPAENTWRPTMHRAIEGVAPCCIAPLAPLRAVQVPRPIVYLGCLIRWPDLRQYVTDHVAGYWNESERQVRARWLDFEARPSLAEAAVAIRDKVVTEAQLPLVAAWLVVLVGDPLDRLPYAHRSLAGAHVQAQLVAALIEVVWRCSLVSGPGGPKIVAHDLCELAAAQVSPPGGLPMSPAALSLS
jgi:hypothetical protein